MLKLLIIADDFTGALDTGIQLAKAGILTKVAINPADAFRDIPEDASVLVVDTESRHLSPAEAYVRVHGLAGEALCRGVPHFYKKTDSALRGNIGADLAALSDACGGRPLVFIPAYPAAGRVTRGGVHYVDGVPAAQSAFGLDPFEPVRHSAVADIIALQTDLPVTLSGPRVTPNERGVTVADAAAEGDLDTVRDSLASPAPPMLLAGCAGFASRLPALLSIPAGMKQSAPVPERALVLSGSVNPHAFRQHACARAHGFQAIELTPEQKLSPLTENSPLMAAMEAAMAGGGKLLVTAADSRGAVEANDRYAATLGLSGDGLRARVARNLGAIGAAYSRAHPDTLMFLIGGDTLVSFLDQMGARDILLLDEPSPGVVRSLIRCAAGERSLISKAGGLGCDDVIVKALGAIGKYSRSA